DALELEVHALGRFQAIEPGDRVLVVGHADFFCPFTMAVFRLRMKAVTSSTARFAGACSSTSRMIALPTMTTSASELTAAACSGDEMPKPTPIGSLVCWRSDEIAEARFSGSVVRAPVTPVSDT